MWLNDLSTLNLMFRSANRGNGELMLLSFIILQSFTASLYHSLSRIIQSNWCDSSHAAFFSAKFLFEVSQNALPAAKYISICVYTYGLLQRSSSIVSEPGFKVGDGFVAAVIGDVGYQGFCFFEEFAGGFLIFLGKIQAGVFEETVGLV